MSFKSSLNTGLFHVGLPVAKASALVEARPWSRRIIRKCDRLRLMAIHDDASDWRDADEESRWAPQLYLRTEPRRLLEYVMQVVPRNESILDLGCNSGADLDILRRAGWNQLSGVDVGREALNLFQQRFPETYALASVSEGMFQDVLPSMQDASVENIISNGATLELVHPALRIEGHLARLARKRIILDICEQGHTYPRDYVAIFASLGLDLVYSRRPSSKANEQSLLHFQRRVFANR